jgi:SNF2 family DNA or RNA helicase
MPLDPYWDAPEYTPAALIKLHAERNIAKAEIERVKALELEVWQQEQKLREQLRELNNRAILLRIESAENKERYDKLSTIEIDFAEQIRKTQELAEVENKISALEQTLRELSQNHKFWDSIMPYQKEDLLYMVNAWDMGLSGVLNANDMGLGKTFETITFDFLVSQLYANRNEGKIAKRLWVTKKSLVKSTIREIQKWFPETAIVPISGGNADQRKFLVDVALLTGAIIICNYETVGNTPSLQDVEWNFVYADEVHRLKGGANYKPTGLWVAMRDLIFKAKKHGCFFVPLSGSPIQNHPKEMWAYLHLFDPVRFESIGSFERTYCAGYSQGIRINFDILIKAMKSQVIRRTMPEVKDQLAQVLHEPIVDVREIELTDSQRRVYTQMKNDFFVWLDDHQEEVLTATVVIAQLNRLRQITMWPDSILHRPVGSAKIDECMDLIEELTSNGEQVVIFSSQFNDPLIEVARRCKKFYDIPVELIMGSNKDTDATCERFRQGETKVLCINAKSGGEGLNLQKSANWSGGASHVIMLDKWWNPKFNEQAIARVYRTGQTDVVTVHELFAANTVDQYIQNILDEKTMMIDSVMEIKDLRKGKTDWKNSLKDVI